MMHLIRLSGSRPRRNRPIQLPATAGTVNRNLYRLSPTKSGSVICQHLWRSPSGGAARLYLSAGIKQSRGQHREQFSLCAENPPVASC